MDKNGPEIEPSPDLWKQQLREKKEIHFPREEADVQKMPSRWDQTSRANESGPVTRHGVGYNNADICKLQLATIAYQLRRCLCFCPKMAGLPQIRRNFLNSGGFSEASKIVFTKLCDFTFPSHAAPKL